MSAGAPDKLDLILLAGRARGRDELFFTIVNRTVAACRYDRASLWTAGRRPVLLAVSGNEPADSKASFSVEWSGALRRLKKRAAGGVLNADSFADAKFWPALSAKTSGLSAVWQPVPGRNAGILFERWGGEVFSPADAEELSRMASAYAMVWKAPRRINAGRIGKTVIWIVLLAAMATAMAVVRLPLRVVANCEVTARTPRLISAPMDGVIDEVLVAPGQRVKAGDRIALYDSRLMEEELKISRRQVAVVEAELASARARGFSEARFRGDTALLEACLEQEMARLEALEVRFSRRVVTAPIDGMVQLDDARAWRGKPVSTGQAILWLVDPEDTRVTLWLPQDDRIDFDMSRPVSIHLHAMGGETREADLTYISTFAQATPDGGYAFPAEAEWRGKDRSPPLGLRGSASIYGEETSLGYWLFRRPMAWVRRWLGV